MSMVSREDIADMKAQGRIVITDRTFKKSAFLTTDKVNRCLGTVPVYEYKGKRYISEWFLTYGHKQYYELIPVKYWE